MSLRKKCRRTATSAAVLCVFVGLPVAASANDVIGFRVLSASPNEAVLEIQSQYSGSQGGQAHLSVLPTVNGQPVSGVGYSAGRCPNSNNLNIGSNNTCITLSTVGGGTNITTNGLRVCLFGGPSRNNFYCETLAYSKHWGSGNTGGLGETPGWPENQLSDLAIANVAIDPTPVLQPQLQLHTYRAYRMNVTVVNHGAMAPGFNVRTECIKNGAPFTLGDSPVGPLGQGQIRQVTYDIFPSSAGTGPCLLRTTVDADRQVNESDESALSNNWDRNTLIMR